MRKKTYEPIRSACKDCGEDFVISVEEQKYFASIGLVLPKRCKDCRKRRKEIKKVITEKQKAGAQQKRWEKDEMEINEIL